MVKKSDIKVKYIKVDGVKTDYIARSDKKVISPNGNAISLSPDGYYTLVIDGKRRRIKGTAIDFPVVKEPKAKVKAPTSIVHTSTKNTSFLRVHESLKQAGVKNNTFMLTLSNPELENVNPRNVALPRETRAAILAEIVENPWYYLREVVRIELTETIVSAIQMALLGVDTYIVLDSDEINSVYSAFGHLNAWINISTTNSKTKVIGSDPSTINAFLVNTPGSGIKWIDRTLFKASVLSTASIAMENTDSETVVSPTPINATAASSIGRDCASNIVMMVGFEQIPSGLYMLQEMVSAFKKTKQNTKAVYSFRTVMTTPTSDDSYARSINETVLDIATKWDNSLYDLSTDKLREKVGEFNFVQIGIEREIEPEPLYKINPRSISTLTWYNDPQIIEVACKLYDTNEFGKYVNGVPESVLKDIIADGHYIPVETYNEQEVQKLVSDYTIRRICEILVENYPIKSTDVGSTLEETLFNTFGTNSFVATNKLLTSNIVSMGRYHNLLMEFMKVCTDITLVNSVGEGGLYNVEHIHAMMKLIYSK